MRWPYAYYELLSVDHLSIELAEQMLEKMYFPVQRVQTAHMAH